VDVHHAGLDVLDELHHRRDVRREDRRRQTVLDAVGELESLFAGRRRATDRTGPKISSLKMRIEGDTPSKIVGSTKKPCFSASGRVPPSNSFAPSPLPPLM